MARPMTITEKILAAHAGLDEVEPGQLVNCRLDIVLANDVTAPIAIREFGKVGRRPGVGPHADRARSRPLRAEQGHQVRRADQAHARLRQGAGDHALLRDRLHGRGARAAARAGRGGPGRRDHRRRQPHLHLRRARRLRHWRGQHRRRRGHGHRRGVVQGAQLDQVRGERRARERRVGEGRHPAHHRDDRRRRRALPGDGVHGIHHRSAGHGWPHDHLQHGHRGRRQERHHRG